MQSESSVVLSPCERGDSDTKEVKGNCSSLAVQFSQFTRLVFNKSLRLLLLHVSLE